MNLTLTPIQERHLLHTIGGEVALQQTVEYLYGKLVVDPSLRKLFENVDMEGLKRHLRRFLSIALTETPQYLDVPDFMLTKHKRLFAMGLNETHFDTVATHLVQTLKN